MSVVVSAVLVLAMLFAMATNRDVFSPGKFYLFSFLLFYAGAFMTRSSYELWLLILLVLMVGVITVALEAAYPLRTSVVNSVPPTGERNHAAWVWVLSVPAIVAQVFVLQRFGGIEDYINVIGNRVVELRGLGWAKTLIGTVSVLNLIYFAIGLTRRRSKFWWIAYLLHLLVLLAMGLLSGSRGAILNVFALQLFVYHYMKRPLKLVHALPVGAVLIAVAMILGVAREGLKFSNNVLTTGIESTDRVLRLAIFKYGVTPLEIILEADELHLAHGTTLLSLATNAVPRALWPDKPDTGGIFFTKEYTGDEWDGASNLTPTLLGEAVINFGWLPGLPFFFLVHVILMGIVVWNYRHTIGRLANEPTAATAVDLVVYVLVMWSIVALMIGEVTNVLLTLALSQLIPAIAFKKFLATAR